MEAYLLALSVLVILVLCLTLVRVLTPTITKPSFEDSVKIKRFNTCATLCLSFVLGFLTLLLLTLVSEEVLYSMAPSFVFNILLQAS